MSGHWANEFDPRAAAWHRQLAADGLTAPVEVDERSIEDVAPAELLGRTHVHFFAGIAGWAHALDLAGWPRDRPVWTGSCPCQPYSQAGAGGGDDDPRALWWAMRWHIAQCGPAVVFGEQVASADGRAWLSGLRADMEALGYAVGAADLGAAGVAAPHIRQRIYWVAVRLADANDARPQGRWGVPAGADQRAAGPGRLVGRLADAGCERDERRRGAGDLGCAAGAEQGKAWQRERRGDAACNSGADRGPGAVHGGWSDADWLWCRDDRWRPVEPGTFPLADGIPARVVRLRGYGNAIVPQVAAAFVAAVMDVIDGRAGPRWLDWEGGA